MTDKQKQDYLTVLHKLYEYKADENGLDKNQFFAYSEEQKAANAAFALKNNYGLVEILKKVGQDDKYKLTELGTRVLERNYTKPFDAIDEIKQEIEAEQDFKTREKKARLRFYKYTVTISWIALIVSILSLLATMYINLMKV